MMISNLFGCDWVFTNLLRGGGIKEHTSAPAQRSRQKWKGRHKEVVRCIIGFDQSENRFIPNSDKP